MAHFNSLSFSLFLFDNVSYNALYSLVLCLTWSSKAALNFYIKDILYKALNMAHESNYYVNFFMF